MEANLRITPEVKEALETCIEISKREFADDQHRKRHVDIKLWDDGDFLVKVKHVEKEEMGDCWLANTYENVNYKDSRGTFEYIVREQVASTDEQTREVTTPQP